MFCPECKAEYRRGFTKCRDCDVELVDTLKEPEHGRVESREFSDADNPIEIARFLDIRQADFAVSVLEGSGIKAYLDQAFTGNMVPYLMLGSGGIRLVVRAEDRERAIEILQSSEKLNQDEVADREDDL
jgi:hypothetical protein